MAAGVFDHAVDPPLAAEFLNDPRHHLVVALEGGTVIGFVSAVHYVNPDKPAELWINEVAVAPAAQRGGVAAAMLAAMFALGRSLGCREAWVLTEGDNAPALGLYQQVGGTRSRGETVLVSFALDGSATS